MSDTAPLENGCTRDTVRLLIPFILTAGLIVADQLSKAWIIATIPQNTIGFRFFGEFLHVIHARNPGIAFSIGRSLPDALRKVLFIVLPLLVMVGVIVYYLKDRTLTTFQRWAIASMLGGGIGNQIDRIFRPAGVVDFIYVRFYGIFGMERWPAFNVADSAIVVGAILFVVASILDERNRKRGQKG